MPTYKQSLLFELARGVKGFLRLEAGLTRSETPGSWGAVHSGTPEPAEVRGRLEQAHQQLAAKDEQISRLHGRVSRLQESLHKGGNNRAANPENIVWIFGTARVGSTWLMNMVCESERHTPWDEPLVGELFGNLFYLRAPHRRGRNFILGDPEETRRNLIRAFVLAAAEAKFPRATEGGYLIIKEPNGSIGAPLLSEALPESRLILLVRDPRDVVASALSGGGEGGWFASSRGRKIRKDLAPVEKPDEIVNSRAIKYLNYLGNAKEAYDSHEGPQALVKYEELRADALGTMKGIYSELGISVDEGELARAVEKHDWENVPEEKKGPGKRKRKATPGGWREDLTPEQARTVERITAPLLEEFYPE